MSGESSPKLFRRRLLAIAGQGTATAEVEDDHHHMIVALRHDDGHVTGIEGQMIRRPYDMCAGATLLLDQLIGLPVAVRPPLPEGFAAKEHCTHLLDVALLALSQAARGGERRYEFQVPEWSDGRTTPRVIRDGREVFRCNLLDDAFLAPAAFIGQTTRAMLPWAERTLDDDMVEIVRLLRRVLMVARGRQLNPDPAHMSAQVATQKLGACFTLHPDRLSRATPEGSFRPLSERPDLFTLPG